MTVHIAGFLFLAVFHQSILQLNKSKPEDRALICLTLCIMYIHSQFFIEMKDDFYLNAVVLYLATAQLMHDPKSIHGPSSSFPFFFLRIIESQLERAFKLLLDTLSWKYLFFSLIVQQVIVVTVFNNFMQNKHRCQSTIRRYPSFIME